MGGAGERPGILAQAGQGRGVAARKRDLKASRPWTSFLEITFLNISPKLRNPTALHYTTIGYVFNLISLFIFLSENNLVSRPYSLPQQQSYAVTSPPPKSH